MTLSLVTIFHKTNDTWDGMQFMCHVHLRDDEETPLRAQNHFLRQIPSLPRTIPVVEFSKKSHLSSYRLPTSEFA